MRRFNEVRIEASYTFIYIEVRQTSYLLTEHKSAYYHMLHQNMPAEQSSVMTDCYLGKITKYFSTTVRPMITYFNKYIIISLIHKLII